MGVWLFTLHRDDVVDPIAVVVCVEVPGGGVSGFGLVGFAGSLWWFKHNLVGSELYYWMWWVVAGYYGLAIAAIQVRSFGVPGIVKGSFHDDRKDTPAPATA